MHIGARLASAASPGEILISEEAAEQAHRVGIEVEDRGVRSLKGLPGRRRVFGSASGRRAGSGSPASHDLGALGRPLDRSTFIDTFIDVDM